MFNPFGVGRCGILGRLHVVADGQVLEVPQGEVAHFAAKDSEEQGAHCEGLGSTRYGAENALQNDDLRAIGCCWDPNVVTICLKAHPHQELGIQNWQNLQHWFHIEPGDSKGANLKETHQFPDLTLASIRVNWQTFLKLTHVIWFNLPTSSTGYQIGASPKSCGRHPQVTKDTHHKSTSSGLAWQIPKIASPGQFLYCKLHYENDK